MFCWNGCDQWRLRSFVTAWIVDTINAVNRVRSRLLAEELRTFYDFCGSIVGKSPSALCVCAYRLLWFVVGPCFMFQKFPVLTAYVLPSFSFSFGGCWLTHGICKTHRPHILVWRSRDSEHWAVITPEPYCSALRRHRGKTIAFNTLNPIQDLIDETSEA